MSNDHDDARGAARAVTVLEARARKLARPLHTVDETAAGDAIEILVFVVGEEQLAVPLSSIVSIARVGFVTPLPRAVAPVYGVTAWRGRPLTVLSVGASAASADAGQRLIVLGDGRRANVGLRVDMAEETQVVARSALIPAVGGTRAAYALGVTSDAVLVLDPTILIHSARPEP